MLNSVAAAGKVFEYLDRKPEVSTDGKLEPDQLEGCIDFHHLNFSYPTNPNKAVLEVRVRLSPLLDIIVLPWYYYFSCPVPALLFTSKAR